jgi:hypothetical protein
MRIPHIAVALAAGLCSAHARRKPNDKHSKRSKLRPSLRTMMRNAGPTAPRPAHKVYIQDEPGQSAGTNAHRARLSTDRPHDGTPA